MANAPENDKQQGAGGEKQPKQRRQPRQAQPAPDAPAAADTAKAAPAPAGARQRGAAPAAGQAPAPAGQGGQTRGGQQRQGGRREAKGAAPAAAAGRPARPSETPRLLVRYRDQVIPALKREFGYTNPMQVPRLRKVSINIGMGEALKNGAAIDAALGDISAITGQKPVITRARISIANFNLREGVNIGVMVTLRGHRMWQFLDRLMNVALPRVRDFRGVPRNSFDGRGNYTLGVKEQVVFPEIDYNRIDRLRGMQINVITNARTDEEGRRLLELLGMPYARPEGMTARQKVQ